MKLIQDENNGKDASVGGQTGPAWRQSDRKCKICIAMWTCHSNSVWKDTSQFRYWQHSVKPQALVGDLLPPGLRKMPESEARSVYWQLSWWFPEPDNNHWTTVTWNSLLPRQCFRTNTYTAWPPPPPPSPLPAAPLSSLPPNDNAEAEVSVH